MANSADPDQLASEEANWSGSSLFANAINSHTMANSADPDQLASEEANWSGSTLFAKAGYIRVQQDKGSVQMKSNLTTLLTLSIKTDMPEKKCRHRSGIA